MQNGHSRIDAVLDKPFEEGRGRGWEEGSGREGGGQETREKGKGSGRKTEAERRAWASTVAVDLVLKSGWVPYCDVTGEMRIRRPIVEGMQGNRPDFPLSSQEVPAWIAQLLYEAGQPLLSAREQTQALQVLRGMALKNEERVECPDVLEMDPVMATVRKFLEQYPMWMGSMTQFLESLRDFGEEAGIMSKNDRRWPPNATHLSRHLKSRKRYLVEMGIVHDFTRYGCQRVHRFSRAEMYPAEEVPAAYLEAKVKYPASQEASPEEVERLLAGKPMVVEKSEVGRVKSEGGEKRSAGTGGQDVVTARKTAEGMASGAKSGGARGKRNHDGNDAIVRAIAEAAAGLDLDEW